VNNDLHITSTGQNPHSTKDSVKKIFFYEFACGFYEFSCGAVFYQNILPEALL